MEKTTKNTPRPTNDPYVLRVREILSALWIVLDYANTHLEDAQKCEEDQDLSLYALECNMTTCFNLLADGTRYANWME